MESISQAETAITVCYEFVAQAVLFSSAFLEWFSIVTCFKHVKSCLFLPLANILSEIRLTSAYITFPTWIYRLSTFTFFSHF